MPDKNYNFVLLEVLYQLHRIN